MFLSRTFPTYSEVGVVKWDGVPSREWNLTHLGQRCFRIGTDHATSPEHWPHLLSPKLAADISGLRKWHLNSKTKQKEKKCFILCIQRGWSGLGRGWGWGRAGDTASCVVSIKLLWSVSFNHSVNQVSSTLFLYNGNFNSTWVLGAKFHPIYRH